MGVKTKVYECMFIMFVMSGVNVSMCACMPVVTLFAVCLFHHDTTCMIPDDNIGPDGAKALTPSLKCLSQLTVLNLKGDQ